MAFISSANCSSVTPSRIRFLNSAIQVSFNREDSRIACCSFSSLQLLTLSMARDVFLKQLPAFASIRGSRCFAGKSLSIPKGLSWSVSAASTSVVSVVSSTHTFSTPNSSGQWKSLFKTSLGSLSLLMYKTSSLSMGSILFPVK